MLSYVSASKAWLGCLLISLLCLSAPVLGWDGTNYNNLINGDYSSSGSGWTTWTERGSVTVTYTSGSYVRMKPNNFNGGIVYKFSVLSSHQYAFSGLASLSGGKDWIGTSTPSCSWFELHLDKAGSTPSNGSDYTTGQICKTDRCSGCETSDNWSRTFPTCCNQALSPNPYTFAPNSGVTQISLVIKTGNNFSSSTATLDTGKLRIVDKGAVVGRVYDGATGTTPLAGATVTMGSKTTTTNAQGYWEIDNAPTGSGQTVTASKSGYATTNYSSAANVTGTSPVNMGNLNLPVVCTPPATPGAPVVTAGSPACSTLNVANNAGDSGTAYFALKISPAVGGGTYVQANGTIGISPVWQTKATWGTKLVTGLASSTSYTFTASAATDATGSCASVFGAGTSVSTAAPNPTISGVLVSPSCVASGQTTAVSATVLDSGCGGGVAQVDIAVYGANLLANPSFESDLTGWTNTSNPTFSINVLYANPSAPKDGAKYAGSSCGYGSGLKTPELRQTFATTAGQKYYFSAWFWNDGSPNVCSGYLQYRQGADPGADGQGTTIASVTSAASGWQFLSGFVTASGTQLTLILRLSWDCGGYGGAGHFDLIEARQCIAPTSYNTGTGAAQWTGVTISAAMFNGQTSGTLTLRAADASGNIAQASSPTVTLDDAPPSTAVTNTPPAYTNTAIPVNWTATDSGCNGAIGAGSVRLYARPSAGVWADSGIAGQSGSSGSFSYTPGADGLYYLQVVASDGLGNAMTAPSGSSGAGQASSTYDATPPSAAQPLSTSAAASSITVNFGASSGDNLSGLSATPYQVTGSDSYNSGLVAGLSVTDSSLPAAGTVVTYTVKTWDMAGNQASQTITGRVPPVDTGNSAVFTTQASTLAPPGLYPNSGKVFASSNGVLYGFNSATPAQLWAPISTGGSVQGRMPVATLNSTLTVLAGSQDGNIYARNAATGAEVWTHDIGSGYKATAKPAGALSRTVGAYTGDVVFAASDKNDTSNFLRAIRADTGATLWTYQPGNLGPIAGSPAVVVSGTGGTVLIASQTSGAETGRVAAVNIADGSEVWQSQIGSVTSSVGVKDDGTKVFAVTDGGSLYSLAVATGATDGGYPLAVGTQPIYGAPFHVPNQNAVLVSLNADGAVKMVSLSGPSVSWTKSLTAPSASLEYRGKVYVGSTDGKLYELNIADGTESASRTIGYTVGDPVVDAINSVLYVGANDGRIYSFSLPF